MDYGEDLARASAVDMEGHQLGKTYLFNPVYCNGRLYAEVYFTWQHTTRLLVVIEKLESCDIEINSTHVFLPPPLITVMCRSRLLQFNNELFHIQITSEGHVILSVVVHQLDFSQMVWERVKNMKDKVFFLSANDLPFACQAINPEAEGGRIYLTLENSKFVYIYNVEDNRLIICHAFSNLPTEVCRSLWFRPDLRYEVL